MILAKSTGLMCIAKVLREEPTRLYIKVLDEKRPKWIPRESESIKLFNSTDEAMEWINEQQ